MPPSWIACCVQRLIHMAYIIYVVHGGAVEVSQVAVHVHVQVSVTMAVAACIHVAMPEIMPK